ncbi:hypothetical protein C3E90_04375 [Clostridium sp. Cult2]|nr:hypothetical protein [Clostridium sp. Cult2]
MKSIFNYFEKTLLLLSLLSLLLLLTIQYFSYNNNQVFSTMTHKDSKLFSFFNSSDSYEKGVIILKNLTPDYNNIEILLNGEYIDDFTKNDEIKIYVHHNDMIEIDGTKYNNPLKIKVIGVSTNMDLPKLDTIVITSQSIEILSKVKLK